VQAKACVDRRALLVAHPIVGAPADRGRLEELDFDPAAVLEGADRMRRRPDERGLMRRVDAVPLPHLGKEVAAPLVGDRGEELQVLGVGPAARRSRVGRNPRHQPARRYRLAVPDLLGQHEARTGEGLEGPRQPRDAVASGQELVLGPFAREQRPGPADPARPPGRAVGGLAVGVADVAPPGRPAGPDPEELAVHLGDARTDLRFVRRP
jgi:hypothetical protein